jgi:DNA-binding transcriptional ArsR family regulator
MAGLFASGARVAVLRVFMIDPRRAYYQRQLSQATKLPIRAIQRELERLTAIGLLYRRTEGNRTYFQVDTEFSLYPELRAMVLKSVGLVDRLRGSLSLAAGVRLAFLDETRTRVLLVPHPGQEAAWAPPPGIEAVCLHADEFREALAQRAALLDAFLVRGLDLLGRREDVIWRRIEAAGYSVPKGEGVP